MGSADVLPTTYSRSAWNFTHVRHWLGICGGHRTGPGLARTTRLCGVPGVGPALADVGVPERHAIQKPEPIFTLCVLASHLGTKAARSCSSFNPTPSILCVCVCVCVCVCDIYKFTVIYNTAVTPEKTCSHLFFTLPPAPGSYSSTSVLWICLFWTFPINGVTHYVAFCV
jgi:hypothetical protein